MAAAAPTIKCNGCPHPPHPGVVCSVCGHIGRSKAYKPSATEHQGPTKPVLHFEGFDMLSAAGPTFEAMFAYAKIMRERVFVTELHAVDVKEEFDEFDPKSRHVYGFIGDAPVAYARWRVFDEAQMKLVLLERLCVLQTHRRRGICKRLLCHALNDITHRMAALSLTHQGVVVHCPNVDFLKNLFAKFGFQVASQLFNERKFQCVRMALTTPVLNSKAPALAEMLAAAPPLGTATGVTDRPPHGPPGGAAAPVGAPGAPPAAPAATAAPPAPVGVAPPQAAPMPGAGAGGAAGAGVGFQTAP